MARLLQRIQVGKTSVKAATKVTMAAIEDHSKYVSRLFANAIHEKLPRELRDMIYDILWTKDLEKYDLFENERPWRATEVSLEGMESLPEDWPSEYGFPPDRRERALGPYPQLHFVNSDWVGDDFAKEAAEAFYRLAGAYIETLNEFYLDDYFDYDNFAAGVEPRLSITSITFFLDVCIRKDKTPDLWGTNHEQYTKLHLSPGGIEAIFGPQPTKMPNITFVIKDEGYDRAIDILERSLPLHHQLKELGASITTILRVPFWINGRSLKVADLGTILELPQPEWEGRILQEYKRQDPEAYSQVEPSIQSVFAYRRNRKDLKLGSE
ncbi:hypothetical protein FB567DRAFT_509145 [Paraphoma chrysanthemicola]|uniref:Uncharacterized protein n=1 Tax=Paraphoma chrysanthemicola TaxID=798071 RepID=A0A8K0VS27_9PLEO|nr:hypothetical protein FB567DRAFT_509145 [Paraphoma chrysanthemicola]